MASEERDQLITHLRRLQLGHTVANLDDLLRDAARLIRDNYGALAIADADGVYGMGKKVGGWTPVAGHPFIGILLETVTRATP